MGRREVVGKEYLLISRRDFGDVPKLLGSFSTLKEANEAKKKAAEQNEDLMLKVECRTLFNTDIVKPDPDRAIISREVAVEAKEQEV